jgi:hypothetical protein
MAENGNISGKRLKMDIKRWICETPFLKGLLSNPFLIAILIVTVIWLLDIVYGKTFEDTSVRETIQHATTVWIVMVSGIFLNNLAISRCNEVSGGDNQSIGATMVSGAQTVVANTQPTHATHANSNAPIMDVAGGITNEKKY